MKAWKSRKVRWMGHEKELHWVQGKAQQRAVTSQRVLE
jgi:hypothetical protein